MGREPVQGGELGVGANVAGERLLPRVNTDVNLATEWQINDISQIRKNTILCIAFENTHLVPM